MPIRIFSPPQPSALSAPSSSTSSPDSEATYRSPTLKAAPTSSSHQSYQTPSSSCQLHISTVDKDRPALPSLESFGSADMSVDSSSDDREDTGLVVEEEIGTAAEESSTEINKRVTVPSKLAAQLVCAILGAVLFEKGQIPTTVQALARSAATPSSPFHNPPSTSRPSYLPTKPSPESQLLHLHPNLLQSLSNGFSSMSSSADASSIHSLSDGMEEGPVMMLLLGPSVLLPKSIFAIQLPSIGPAGEDGGEGTEGEERKRKIWDTLERGVLRGLIGRNGMTEAIAPTKTHILFSLPRSFSSPLFLPRPTLSSRFDTLLAPIPSSPSLAPSSAGSPALKKKISKLIVKKPKLPVETWTILLDGALQERAGVKVVSGLGGRGGEGDGDRDGDRDGDGENKIDDERIWFEWEGGAVQGWKTR